MEDKLQQNDEIKSADTFAELDIEILKGFINSPDHSYSTAHKVLCFAIIARIYRRTIAGYYFGPIKADEDMIIDGNHRYVAYKLAKVEFEIVKATRSYCDELKSFNDIVIDMEQDWDANHSDYKKYCTDEFLEKGNYRRN